MENNEKSPAVCSKPSLNDGSNGTEAPSNMTGGGGIPHWVRPIKIKTIADAQRLLSRLIFDLQKGQVGGRLAKDLCYLLINYVQISRDTVIEARVEAIEMQLSKNQGRRK
jgi:hypothetical protein